MEGGVGSTWWLFSHVMVCFTLLCLSFAVAALYRLLAKPGDEAPASLGWPLRNILPGNTLGDVDPANATRAPHTPYTGFVFFSIPERDAFSSAFATAVVARSWLLPLRILVREGSMPRWLSELSACLSEFPAATIHRVTDRQFKQLGIEHVPVIIFTENDLVIEAATGLFAPNTIRNHFACAARNILAPASEAELLRENARYG